MAQRTAYNILFRSVSDTLKQFAKDGFNEETGFIAILHTGDQKLNRHLHLHCIVPGVTVFKRKYLFPVKALSYVFRGKFMDELKEKSRKGRLSCS